MSFGSPSFITLPGIDKIFLCDGGLIAQTIPTNPVLLRIRKSGGKFSITPLDEIKDFKDGIIMNRFKCLFEGESLSIGLAELKKLLAIARAGVCDAQILFPDSFSGTLPIKVFTFSEALNQGIGLDFEFKKTIKEASTKITLQNYIFLSDLQTDVVSAIMTNTPHSMLAAAGYYDTSKIVNPNLSLLSYNIAGAYTQIFDRKELKDVTFGIKTIGDTSDATGMMQPAYLNINLSVSARNAELWTLATMLQNPIDLGFKMVQVTNANTETYDIKPGVLFATPTWQRGDGNSDSISTLTWNRNVAFTQVAITGETTTTPLLTVTA